ncbi:hypothetical protein [Cryobacterium sp.]|jgi:hypothetical protein|uniref:hypothetical protein n=1 Tax=Cryobacterium sp. TaxID=1926290 RepID=UPI0026070C56|nr:hypothetical protein [Cryobacterium sp.]MCU1445278.1 hypothetical protein [Cryobacterium sp.]
MTIPRLLLAIAIAVGLYILGANTDRLRTGQIIRSARAAWEHPEAKKDRKRLQKISKKNAKKITKGIYD